MQTARTSRTVGQRNWKLLGLLPLLVLSGCQNAAGTGAAAGGVGGALIGNAVAKAAGGSRTAGTIVGGMLGAVTGAVVGDHVDQSKRDAEARGRASALAQQNALRAPTLQEIVGLSQHATPDSVIINQIRTTGATYPNLSAQDILYLRENGVSATVISEMQMTSVPRMPQRVYSTQPVTLVEPTPVFAPPPSGVSAGLYYRTR